VYASEPGGRYRRQINSEVSDSKNEDFELQALLLEKTNAAITYDEGAVSVLEETKFKLYLVGRNMELVTRVKFTTANNTQGGDCKGDSGVSHHQTQTFEAQDDEFGRLGYKFVDISELEYQAGEPYYVCLSTDNEDFQHQGSQKTVIIKVTKLFMPIWLMGIICVVLLCMSGLFSGLNLGLMSLDHTELAILINTGSDTEKRYAKSILPVRRLGNFLLCSILLGNVLVNNTLTIFLDNLTGGGGTIAVIFSTLGIVIFGEIIPQALCSRHGLMVGANTIFLTKFFMFLTSPLSFPLSKVLDCVLGTEIGTVYNRERLIELMKVTEQYNGLEKKEINIVHGALVLKQKNVKDVMTPLDDCYMLPIDTDLNFEALTEIKEQGYSRIPVYEGERNNIVHILYAKDLLFIDPDDEKPIEEVCKFYKNEVNFVYDDVILTDMFDEFKSGEKGHMAVVQEVVTAGSGDPYLETVGLITLEDIVEEIIQQEIVDETDVIIDNKTKKKRKRERYKKDADFKMFCGNTQRRVQISPSMSLAILQFLTTTVKAFSPEHVSRRIVQRLLNMDVYRELKISKKKDDLIIDENEGVLMTKGKPCDFFILILEGRVEVTIGKEEHKFQEGPFSYFGEQMLEQAMMIPQSPHVTTITNLNQENNIKNSNMNNNMNSNMNSNSARKTTSNQTISQNISHNELSGINKNNRVDSLPLNKQTWTPDYSLKAVTDCTYLKIRKNTYMVAIKASRMNNMNSEVDGNIIKEQELEEYLKKITENDADFTGVTPNIMSPENLWQSDGKVSSNAGTPNEFRRESIRSSLSMMKQKIFGTGAGMGRSCTSIDKPVKDEFFDFDGMTNPALTTSKDDVSDQTVDSGKESENTPPGINNIPLTSVVPEVNIPGRNHDIKVGNNTTVISVRGSGATKDNTSFDSEKNGANKSHGLSNERTNSFNTDDVENPVS